MMIWGIVMLICGIAAIALPWASGIGVVIVVAWVILFAAVSHLVFAFHTHGVGGVLWQILLALIYGAAGVFMLMNPLAGLVTLTLVLAIFLGFEVISKVPTLLHTPLMSGTNAIHGIVVLGGMIVLGESDHWYLTIIGILAVVLGAANVAGAFVVTDRMLEMFKKKEPKPGAKDAK